MYPVTVGGLWFPTPDTYIPIPGGVRAAATPLDVTVEAETSGELTQWWLVKLLGQQRARELRGMARWALQSVAGQVEQCDEALRDAIPDVAGRVVAALDFIRALAAQLREDGVTVVRVGWVVATQIGAHPIALN
eukprot:gene5835-24010_t